MTEQELQIQISLNTLKFRDITEETIRSVTCSILLRQVLKIWLTELFNPERKDRKFATEIRILNAFLNHSQLEEDQKDFLDECFNTVYIKAYF